MFQLILAALATIVVLLLLFLTVRFIPNNRVGVVEKRFSAKGSLKSGLIALHGEAGFQPEVLRGGIHLLVPFQYRVHTVRLITIPQGKIGYLFARDGVPLDDGQVLGRLTESNNYQDVRAFLKNEGQRGPQRQILREGTYAINLAQFIVITEEKVYYLPLNRAEEGVIQDMAKVIGERDGFRPVVLKDQDDKTGIVTVHDGPSLSPGEIIAPIVGGEPTNVETYHNNFQAPDRFLKAGGLRGRQLQVLVEGTYYLNRLFATVEMIPKTIIEIGTVGVVVFYTGEAGRDLSGEDYRHGELVARGHRGVWDVPLMPGKYAFNTYAGST